MSNTAHAHTGRKGFDNCVVRGTRSLSTGLFPSFPPSSAAGCGLLVSEIFLDRDRRGPSRGLLQALGLGEGKQRSTGEYRALLESHGFTVAHVAHTDSLLDVLLCVKD